MVAGIQLQKFNTIADNVNKRIHQSPLLEGTHQNSATSKLNVVNTLFCEDHGLMSFIEAPEAVPASKAFVVVVVWQTSHTTESNSHCIVFA